MHPYASLCVIMGLYMFLFVLMDSSGSLSVLIGPYVSL